MHPLLHRTYLPHSIPTLSTTIHLLGWPKSSLRSHSMIQYASFQMAVLVAACGIFFFLVMAFKLLVIQFPVQGSNLGPLHQEGRVLAIGPPGKALAWILRMTKWHSPKETRELQVTQLLRSRAVTGSDCPLEGLVRYTKTQSGLQIPCLQGPGS